MKELIEVYENMLMDLLGFIPPAGQTVALQARQERADAAILVGEVIAWRKWFLTNHESLADHPYQLVKRAVERTNGKPKQAKSNPITRALSWHAGASLSAERKSLLRSLEESGGGEETGT